MIDGRAVVASLIPILQRNYVFPEVALKVSEQLSEKMSNGLYDGYDASSDFTAALNRDLYEFSHDHHLRVRYSPGNVGDPEDDSMTLTTEILEEMRRELSDQNFGFQKVERMDGNIGYIDLRCFAPAEIGGDTAVAAMNFIAHTSALILDLRNNGGGVPTMVDLLCGYLFRPSVNVNSLYWGKSDRTDQNWSLPYVPGRHYGTKPVYILISSSTFSAAEEMAYTLKHYQRATLIGEKTLGGANPGRGFQFTADFELFVPMGRAVHPITASNWEGTGVAPDVSVPADDALNVAHNMALQNALSTVTNPSTRAEIEQALNRANPDMAAHSGRVGVGGGVGVGSQ